MRLGRKVNRCRYCESSELYEFLDLGLMPPADGILTLEETKMPETLFPLIVCQCQGCGLTQLKYAVDPNILYGDKYRYESSITTTGRTHFFNMASSLIEKFKFSKGSLSVDIGSNVGVLLEGFKNNGLSILGIDPAPKVSKIANSKGIETWQEFFGEETAEKIIEKKGKAKIITGTNVFAHIDDKKDIIKGIKKLLDDDGVFIIEAPYFVDLVDKLEYDTIYLDHLEYLSVKPLVNFFENNGMEVFDVEKQDIHGSSIRVFVSKKGKRPISDNVGRFLELERNKKIYHKRTLDDFSDKVRKHKKQFLDLLRQLKKDGNKIIGISAPAKGNTLLNYCKIDENLISYMTEKSKIKQGNYTPGMHIPIKSDEDIYKDNPDYGVIFAWNFAEEIMKNNKDFLRNGGKFIIPIPNPKIIGNEDLFGAEVQKIEPAHIDDRGEITDLLNEKVNHVGFITTKAGVIRANHYHNISTQYSYILKGKFEILLALADNPENVKRVILNPGELITIPPRVIHRFKALEDSHMVDMVSESREGTGFEDDVFRVKIGEDT